jgi:hypothetical protein
MKFCLVPCVDDVVTKCHRYKTNKGSSLLQLELKGGINGIQGARYKTGTSVFGDRA